MGIYEKLGVKRIINARGSMTSLGGSVIPQEILEVMNSAAESFVDMNELAKKAGEVVAEVTGAEAGLVTCGAAAGLVLASAACMTGKNFAKIDRLPNTDGMKNEIIIQRMHRNPYDRHLRIAGTKLVEVGDRSQTWSWEIEAAISEKTAAIAYFPFDPQPGVLPLQETVKIAHKFDIPVIVDAAGGIPPFTNLRKYIKMRADLVVFSGGKAISGPNDTGILCGKKELIEAAALNGFPPNFPYFSGKFGIGRAMKVSKEQMVGLIASLKSYMKKDHKAEMKKWARISKYMAKELNVLSNIEARVTILETGPRPVCIPKVEIIANEKALGVKVSEIVESLEEGNPAIAVISSKETPVSKNKIYLNPQCLFKGEGEIVVERLQEILMSRRDSECD